MTKLFQPKRMNLTHKKQMHAPRCWICLTMCLAVLGCGEQRQPVANKTSQRIVSLAPNLTEIAFALGLDDRVIGTTTFCTYPPAAQQTAKIGNYANLNYEAIVTLKPDLVLLLDEYDEAKARLTSLGIPYCGTGSFFMKDILAAIKTIGKATHTESEATALIHEINSRIAAIETDESINRPRVLITFSRQNPEEPIEQIYAIGPGCIHHELLELAGGINCIEGNQPFATISREALMRLNPDIIIELAADMKTTENATDAWSPFNTVSAVKTGSITVLTGDYTCIPGPRFIQTLEDFHRIIEAFNAR